MKNTLEAFKSTLSEEQKIMLEGILKDLHNLSIEMGNQQIDICQKHIFEKFNETLQENNATIKKTNSTYIRQQFEFMKTNLSACVKKITI